MTPSSEHEAGPVISVVVPVLDEVGNVGPLIAEIDAALKAWGKDFEIIFVDDGSSDGTPEALQALTKDYPHLTALRHTTNAGQSRAIRNGVLHARGFLVMTLDGDGQNDPTDAPALIDEILNAAEEARIGMVAGQRRERRDVLSKRIGSKIANGIRRWALKDGAADTGCALRIFRRDVYLALPFFDNMHRFFPALVQREGWHVLYRDVSHRERLTGSSKYTNWKRFWLSVADLRGVMWLRKRCRLPQGLERL